MGWRLVFEWNKYVAMVVLTLNLQKLNPKNDADIRLSHVAIYFDTQDMN